MKAWAIRYTGVESRHHDALLFWSGDDMQFTSNLARAVCFARKEDAVRALNGMPLLRGGPVEVEIEEPETGQRSVRGVDDDAAAAGNADQQDRLRNPEG